MSESRIEISPIALGECKIEVNPLISQQMNVSTSDSNSSFSLVSALHEDIIATSVLPYLELNDLGELLGDKDFEPVITRYIQEPIDLIAVFSFKNVSDLPSPQTSSRYAYVRVMSDKENALYFADKEKKHAQTISLTNEQLAQFDDVTQACYLYNDDHRALRLSQAQMRCAMTISNHIPSTEFSTSLKNIGELHHKDAQLYQAQQTIHETISAEVKRRTANLPWYKKVCNYTVSTISKSIALAGSFVGAGLGGYSAMKYKDTSSDEQAVQDSITTAEQMAEAKTDAFNRLKTFISNCNPMYSWTIERCGYSGWDDLSEAENPCFYTTPSNCMSPLNDCVHAYSTHCYTSTNPEDYYNYDHPWEKSAYATIALTAIIGAAVGVGYAWKKWGGNITIENHVASEYKDELDRLLAEQKNVRDRLKNVFRSDTTARLVTRLSQLQKNSNDAISTSTSSTSNVVSIDISSTTTPLLSSSSSSSVTNVSLFTTSSATVSLSNDSIASNDNSDNVVIEFKSLDIR